MATTTSLLETLSSLQSSTQSALQSLPTATSTLPPENGISLLDTKNEIFLAYLQALALRNLHVIRSLKDGVNTEDAQTLSDELTAKLVEHRVYLERGVKPLEQKMKYQIERAVGLAADEERNQAQKTRATGAKNRRVKDGESESADDSGSESDEAEDAPTANASTFRPGNFANAQVQQSSAGASRRSTANDAEIYRPPRISATSMPTTESREPKTSRPARSRTLDEYITTELSAAPLPEPSIGSTITASGRRTKSSSELKREQERTNYEETHLTRLPPESKKERAKQKAWERRSGFGGEEWRGLGESVNRIGDLTRRKKEGALERSRKRGRAVEDGPRGDGRGVGGAFEVKKRRIEKKARR